MCPLRCTSMTASHSGSVMLNDIVSRRTPALFTRMSRWPNASIACCTSAPPPLQVATSWELGVAVPPASLISATASEAIVESRSLTTTRAPSLARSRAWPRPMPPPAPVTTATLPARSPTRSRLGHPERAGQGDDLARKDERRIAGLQRGTIRGDHREPVARDLGVVGTRRGYARERRARDQPEIVARADDDVRWKVGRCRTGR